MSSYLGHCRQCDYALFVEPDQITTGEDWRKLYPGEARSVIKDGTALGVYAHCPTYGHKAFRLYQIQGKFNPDHECDQRCLQAKGNECTCSCGGANHGRGHIAKFEQAHIPESIHKNDVDASLTQNQDNLIRNLLDERQMPDDAREKAFARLEGLTKRQASAWIEKLFTLPRK